jgi:DNA-binding MarR family transcriptional regulator
MPIQSSHPVEPTPFAEPPPLTEPPRLVGGDGSPPEVKDQAGDQAEHLAGVPRGVIVGFSELLVRLILANRAVERISPSQGPSLSPHAVRATMHLFQHGQGTVGELAEGLGVSMGWASRIADELERAGHVQRERDALDRRVVRLRLSPPFAHIAEEMYRERGRAVAEALAALRQEEREAVRRFLRRLIEGLEGLAGSSSPAD